MPDQAHRQDRRRTIRWLTVGLLYTGLLVSGSLAGPFLPDLAGLPVQPGGEPELDRMILLLLVVYVAASALPFIPGAEIGFGLIAVFGAQIAMLVYACMVGALLIAFLAGRLVPARLLATLFSFLSMTRAEALARELAEMPLHQRRTHLQSSTAGRAVGTLVRYRYIALALALNLPGNTVLGGGGGIALFAGMSRLYPVTGFLVTTLIAVTPVPLLVLLTGYQP